MLSYRWPGNVRELRNSIFRAAMLARDPRAGISAMDLKLKTSPASSNGKAALEGDLNEVERQMIFSALERFGGNQGKAAEALGISRRTLLRKLKAYRQDESDATVGTLSAEQERYYRTDLDAPVTITHGHERIAATLRNISIGGAGLVMEKTLSFGTPVSIYFTIPETEEAAELIGRVAWSNHEGQHGIQFGEIPSEARMVLQRWLQSQMQANGWQCETAKKA
jgi:Bacterial regulatory protein, Fis family/PilZ domain